MSREAKIQQNVEIPKDIEVSVNGKEVSIKGPKGQITKTFPNPNIKIEKEDNMLVISSRKSGKREKKIIGTFKAAINNMITGGQNLHKYTLKICSGHFPMNVSLSNAELTIKNFFGEKYPRKLRVKQGVDVKIDGDLIHVEGIDKERCGQVAADIENLTRRTAYDRRIFQDGIYIIKKDDKEIK